MVAPAAGARRVDVAAYIDHGTRRSLPITVAVICFVAIVFDGLDSALFGTLLPAVMKDMQFGPIEAGFLASIGHAGAVGGALLFGIAADAYGRKRMLLVGITLFTVFSAACGLSQGFVDFAVYRFIAGIGLAGIVPIAVALVYEFTPGRRKAMVSSMSYIGLSVGVLLSALLSIAFLSTVGWRAILLGTLACILLIPVALLWLPESMSILVRRGRRDQIRKTLQRVAPTYVASADDHYDLNEPVASKMPLGRLLQGEHARNTLLLGIASQCLQMVAVALMTWISHLMVQRGFTLTAGITFVLVFSASNLVSTPFAGWLADRVGYRKVFTLYMPVLFVSIVLTGVVPGSAAAFACMFFAGFAVLGAICVLLPYSGSLYPMSCRSTAMGLVYAIGRIGPIIGPAAVGFMLAAQWSVAVIFAVMAAPSLVALAALLLVQEVPASAPGRRVTSLAANRSCEMTVEQGCRP